jgi:hypothetical protein
MMKRMMTKMEFPTIGIDYPPIPLQSIYNDITQEPMMIQGKPIAVNPLLAGR